MRRHTLSCWCETGEQGHRCFTATFGATPDEWTRHRAYIEARLKADLMSQIQRHGGPWGWNVGVLDWTHDDEAKDELT
jgi:hypothetical protein